MTRRAIAIAGTAVLALTLAACGQQTDERVDVPSGAATASAMAPLPSQDAALAPFVTVDCVSGQVMPVDAPPNGTTIGAVTAIFQPNGAPAITVATDAQPATELGVADISEGTGQAVVAGDSLTVDYCGVGLGGRTVFDRGTPATFPLDGVIAGWQQGLVGMKVGGQRLLVIPAELGYGDQGNQGIAPGETLIFVVQLQSIG
ncbi:MAG: FKBP-type peptidyl-prolyl cis-trans isomerase [Actinobacteria bacterium]|nr:FKBP-type peptidyl-prolyl cis-trans isomerase [Actinomycetota bacterium]